MFAVQALPKNIDEPSPALIPLSTDRSITTPTHASHNDLSAFREMLRPVLGTVEVDCWQVFQKDVWIGTVLDIPPVDESTGAAANPRGCSMHTQGAQADAHGPEGVVVGNMCTWCPWITKAGGASGL